MELCLHLLSFRYCFLCFGGHRTTERSIMWALQISPILKMMTIIFEQCALHTKQKWMGTASMLMSSKIILRDILMIMKWHRNEKQTAPFHPDELTGALTETPGVDWPRRTGGEATVLPTPAPQTLFIRTLVFSHKKSLIPCTNAPMNIKFWQLPRPLKDLSLKRSDFLRPAAGTWTVLWVDVCQVPCQVQCL